MPPTPRRRAPSSLVSPIFSEAEASAILSGGAPSDVTEPEMTPPPERTAAFMPGDLVRTYIGTAPVDATVEEYRPPKARKFLKIVRGEDGQPVYEGGNVKVETEHPGKVVMKSVAKGEKLTRTDASVFLLRKVGHVEYEPGWDPAAVEPDADSEGAGA